MKSPYVSELQPNQVITATLLVQHKEVRQKKTGEPYLSLTLGDRTGDIDARMWDNAAEVIDVFDRDDFVKVRGLMQVHQGRLQLTVHKLSRQALEFVDQTDFFPASARDLDQMLAELRAIVANIRNPHLQSLLQAFLQDPEIVPRLRVAPAAKHVHHAFLGGLLEHVLSMCSVAKLLGAHYRDIDMDLLLTGVILHDIGKIHELTYERSFGYSTEGQLLGHISIGFGMIDNKIREVPGFPGRLRTLLQHMILSHHGQLEYGSPKVPLFPEALLLHHIDNMDSKMECMRSCIEKDRAVESSWTSYVSSLDRSILKKQKFLDGPTEAPALPPTAPQPAAPQPEPQHAVAVAAMNPAPPPQRPAFQRATSAFAEKLKGALGRDS
ncbi:MAG TPA: HD domain-containing protein [Bryobacteraceae bacterium]|nr:HD domain-containing protein [Bryobacteraceae bacterium]